MQTIEELKLKKEIIIKELEYLKSTSIDVKRIKQLQKQKTYCTRQMALIRFRLKNKKKCQEEN